MRNIIVIAAVAAIGFAGYVFFRPDADSSARATTSAGDALVRITQPSSLLANSQIVGTAFDAKCATCHDAIPLNRYGSEDEIASVITFLCSPGASYVTGQIIAVDGGFEATGIGLPSLRDG